MYQEIIKRWKKANPIMTHALGIHEYDGKLQNYDPLAISTRISELKHDLGNLEKSRENKDSWAMFGHELIQVALEAELFELEERKNYKDNPVSLIYPLAIVELSYTARSFDTVENRVKMIIKFEEGIPKYIDQCLQVLNTRLHTTRVQMAIQFLSGIIAFYRDRLISFIAQIDNEDLLHQWSEVNISAIKSMENFVDVLNNEYLTNATSNFMLGKDSFMKLLAKTEGIEIDIDTMLKIGELDLEKNYQALVKIAHEFTDGDLQQLIRMVKTNRPEPTKLIEETRLTIDRTKKFLIDADIITIPTEDQPELIQMPDFARGMGFAAMSIPGPFEVKEASESYYWINPPQFDWPIERQNKFMEFFNYSSLEMITIHEVWPGHYLQLLYNRKMKSDIVKMFSRSLFLIEGWGHYAEEMIYEAGYQPFDRNLLHAGQLLLALQRNVRYLVAIRMHCYGMSVDEARTMFIERALMGEDNATIEANRGTIDPMYLNYTLGKLMIKKLRDDFERENPDKFDLKEFHNRLLSYGSPPIRILRKLLLNNPDIDII